MPTRNVVLSDHHHEVIDNLVRSGRYQNASEVLREGLRLIEAREIEDVTRLKALREAAQVGWDHLDAGRYIDVSDNDLDQFIGQLGVRASERLRRQG
ncbi:MAG: type II toxin-antitoxin system ParD family antitoxin [Sphingomonas sp.]|nr:type II toxin-antitoxin system ParD family antitoxin [Sphingomonas sp.]